MKYIARNDVDNKVLIQGDECVCSLKELYVALTNSNCTEIEITKEFADKYFTFTALCDFVENCGTVAPNVAITVQGTSYSDLTGAVRSLAQYSSPEELEFALLDNPTKILSTITSLCKYYRDTRDEAIIANAKLSDVLMQLEQEMQESNTLREDYAKLMESRNDTDAKLSALVNRVNFRYEKTINPDNMFISQDNKFKHILYIKEITRVHYLDTMVYYLQEVLRTLYTVPVRTVAIEPYYSYGRENLYPGYKPHWKLTYQDVYSGNIMMAGFQPKLMGDILLNSNHVHYLIVIDRGGYMSEHVQGRNVSTLYTVSDLKDLDESVPKDRIISYSEDTLNIPYIEGFDELSPEDKIHKYSSTRVLSKLIDILEEEI